MKPEMWTEEVFNLTSDIRTFNKHHKTKFESWGSIMGELEEWEDKSVYKMYVNWYNKTYTKLGQALK